MAPRRAAVGAADSPWALPGGAAGARLLPAAGAAGLGAAPGEAAAWAASAGGACGLDAEWAPGAARPAGGRGARGSPAALVLQVAFSSRASAEGARIFVVDLLGASQALRGEVRSFLERVLADTRLAKLGFGVRADLLALSCALCECPACRPARDDAAPPAQHLDLAGLAAPGTLFDLSQWTPRRRGGLAGLTRALLGRHLDKTMQTSDWAARPLSAAQVEYAAADAAVLLDLLGSLVPLGEDALVQRALEAQAAQARERWALGGAGGRDKARKGPGKEPPPENDAVALRRRLAWGWDSGDCSTVPAAAAKFVCCETVEGLARQLRLVGADALSSRANCPAGMDSQRWMLELAEPGDRLILTCDRRFFLSHCADRAFFVGSRGKKAQLAEVVGALRLEIGPGSLLSRCVKCSGELRLLSPEEAAAGACEAYLRAPHREYWECSGCRQTYWKGHTYHRAIAALGELVSSMGLDSGAKEEPAPPGGDCYYGRR